VLGLLPFFHIYGMVVVMNSALRLGGTVVTMPKFDPPVFLDIMKRESINVRVVVSEWSEWSEWSEPVRQ
tara:strand:- start:38 stop:244 length:207 start_codon:yes stop_codon:yes gene_type:complete